MVSILGIDFQTKVHLNWLRNKVVASLYFIQN